MVQVDFWIKHSSSAYSTTSEHSAIMIYTFTSKALQQAESFLIVSLIYFLLILVVTSI
jgi:hypothetical protein